MMVIAFTSQHETKLTKPISLSQGHTFPRETRLLTRIKCSERLIESDWMVNDIK